METGQFFPKGLNLFVLMNDLVRIYSRLCCAENIRMNNSYEVFISRSPY